MSQILAIGTLITASRTQHVLRMQAIRNPKDPEALNLYMRGVENNDDALKASPRTSSHSTTSSREKNKAY